jgi:hypothetical protein
MSITLGGTNPAVTFPDGTIQNTSANLTAPYTSNGVVYASSTTALSTGSALTFDGTNLGVGIATGLAKLHLYGSGQIGIVESSGNYTTTGSGYIRWKDVSGNAAFVGYGGNANNFDIFNALNGAVTFSTNATEVMRLTSTGLGIGTSSPSQKLEVATASGGTIGLRYIGNSGIATVGTDANNNLLFSIGNPPSEKMRLDASGNLGLGVTPSTWSVGKAIEVSTSGNAIWSVGAGDFYMTCGLSYNGAFKYAYSGGAVGAYEQYRGNHYWYNAPSGTAGNTANLITAMTLDPSGNLLVGTSTGTTNGGYYFAVGSSSSFDTGHATGTASGATFQRYTYAGSVIGSISQSGTTAVLYNVTSDQRLKENIVDAPEFGSVIDSIQVRSFDWKTDHTHQRAGFIAQELVTVAPEAVHSPVNEEDMMAVDYSKLVPMLVKEIQSLRKRILTLENK